MCGIVGAVGVRLPDPMLQLMAATIAHRGPDDEVVTNFGDAAFGFRRLSIIDVVGGRQPIANETEDAWIVLNGEIYNHHELREQLYKTGHAFRTNSDVEVAMHLWEEDPQNFVRRLRGMFALAIWSKTQRRLTLARDPFGKKPLWYTRLPAGGLLFASEAKALLQHPGVEIKPNMAAIDDFLRLGYVPSPDSAFVGIRRLPPGSVATVDSDGRMDIRRYWTLDFGVKTNVAEAEAACQLRELLREAVGLRLESEVPLGAYLSGGLDSTAVVAFAAERVSRLRTFSIGFESSAHDESAHARTVAEWFGTDHHALQLAAPNGDTLLRIAWHYDQPFGDPSAIPTFALAEMTKPHVTVVLTGDGGDEMFGGYDRYDLVRLAPYFHLPAPVRRAIHASLRPVASWLPRGSRVLRGDATDARAAYCSTMTHFSASELSAVYTPEFAQFALRRVLAPAVAWQKAGIPSMLDSMLATDIATYLPDDLLVKMDVATMAHGVEARCPLLDTRLAEFAASLDPRLKLHQGQKKRVLRAALSGLVPPTTLDRPKQGFGIPLAAWLRGPWRELVGDVCGESRFVELGYLKRQGVARLRSSFNAGDDRHQYALWHIVMLELWARCHLRAPRGLVGTGARLAPISSETS